MEGYQRFRCNFTTCYRYKNLVHDDDIMSFQNCVCKYHKYCDKMNWNADDIVRVQKCIDKMCPKEETLPEK